MKHEMMEASPNLISRFHVLLQTNAHEKEFLNKALVSLDDNALYHI